MKTWMKTLVATLVISAHALTVSAAMRPGDAREHSGMLLAQQSETEWMLPEIVVTASAAKAHGERGRKHAARCEADCPPHCDNAPMQVSPT